MREYFLRQGNTIKIHLCYYDTEMRMYSQHEALARFRLEAGSLSSIEDVGPTLYQHWLNARVLRVAMSFPKIIYIFYISESSPYINNTVAYCK